MSGGQRRESRGSRNAFERTVSRYGIALLGAFVGAAIVTLLQIVSNVVLDLAGDGPGDELGISAQLWNTADFYAAAAMGVLFVAVEPWLPASRWRRSLVFGGIAVTGLAGLRVLSGDFDFGDGRLVPLLVVSLGMVLVSAMVVPVFVGVITRNTPAAWSQGPEIGYAGILFALFWTVADWQGIGRLGDSLWLLVGSLAVLVVLSVLAWRIHEGIDKTLPRGGRWLIALFMVLGVAEAIILVAART